MTPFAGASSGMKPACSREGIPLWNKIRVKIGEVAGFSPQRLHTNLVESLIEMSDMKGRIVNGIILDETNIHGFLPMAYDALRELLEAYCILHGYKVGNHDCPGKLVKELAPEFDLFTFDRLRYVRNGINYYGTKIALIEGKELIGKIFLMRQSILAAIREKTGHKQ